jgi:hypothetical protein
MIGFGWHRRDTDLLRPGRIAKPSVDHGRRQPAAEHFIGVGRDRRGFVMMSAGAN